MNVQHAISLLQSRGLTQMQIASEIGCSQANISICLKRAPIRPSNKLVSGLCKILVKYGLNNTPN